MSQDHRCVHIEGSQTPNGRINEIQRALGQRPSEFPFQFFALRDFPCSSENKSFSNPNYSFVRMRHVTALRKQFILSQVLILADARTSGVLLLRFWRAAGEFVQGLLERSKEGCWSVCTRVPGVLILGCFEGCWSARVMAPGVLYVAGSFCFWVALGEVSGKIWGIPDDMLTQLLDDCFVLFCYMLGLFFY